jgi:hypothetical protein
LQGALKKKGPKQIQAKKKQKPPFGLTITPATYWGVVGVIGLLLVPRRWCQNDAQRATK